MADGKIGIALGGGAARGWAHIGVLRRLVDAGIQPEIVAGTSIGAVAGGCFAIDMLDALEEFARSLTRRKVFGYLDFNLAGSGIISGQRLANVLDQQLPEIDICQLDRSFTAIATEMGTGHEIWLSRGSLVSAMRASYALPGIFRPVKLDDRWLIDGALVNPIPVSVCRARGARVVIAVNLQTEMYGRGTVLPEGVRHGLAEEGGSDAGDSDGGNGAGHTHSSALRLLHRQFFGRGDGAPGITTVMMEAIHITQDRIARSRLAGDPPDVTINVRVGEFGLFEFHRASELICLGEQAADREMDHIKEALGALLD